MSLTKRIEWIDISKGIAIFLMVMGHTSIPEMGAKFIWSFHMPLFFLVSGFLYAEERNKEFVPFLKKIARKLLVPFLFFSVINYIGFKFVCPGGISLDVDRVYLTGWKGIALWFVQVLFLVELLYNRLLWIRIKLGKIFFISILVLLYFVGYYLFKTNVQLPYTTSTIFHAIVFFAIGNVAKKMFMESLPNIWISILIVLSTFVFAQFLPRLDLCFNNYGIVILNSLLAVWGAFGVFSISKIFSSYNKSTLLKGFFVWAGKNTYIIMGVSQFLIISLNEHLSPLLKLPNAFDSLLRYSILWIALYLLSLMFNKYIPVLVGK